MPVVDGFGISAGMMSTPGLELTNFIDPKLTWTKVAKGNRSARRAKRPSSNSAVDPPLTNGKTMNDKTVSESEKLGVAVLGRRFGNMIEHVPLKKRMTMFQSPSPPPPQTPSPQIEVSEQKLSHPNSPDEQLPSGTNFDGNTSEASKEKNGFFEDFSGIEMLATAACDNTLGNGICHAVDGHSVQGGDSAPSAVPLENTEVSLKDTNLLVKDTCLEVKTEVSPVQDNPICFSDKSTHEKDEMNVDESSTSRDSRLHWDLNVPMDAWEQPCESAPVDFDNSVPKNRSVDKLLTTFKINEEEQQDIKLENVHCSLIAHEDNQVSLDFGDLPLRTSGLRTEENKLEVCSGALVQEPLAVAETSMEDSSNSRPIDGTDEQKKPRGFVQVESHVSVIENVTCEAESTVLNEDTEKFGRNSCEEKISMGSFQSPEPVPDEVEPTPYVEKVVLPRSSPNYEDKFKSPAVDGTGHHADNAVTSSDPTSSSGKGNKEDPSDASCSGVYQDRKSNFENSTELQAGYDSQIEDGELREPYLHCWEENEEDDDTQFLDYGSECEEQSLETQINEKKTNVDRGLTPGSDNVKHAEVTGSGKVQKHADDLHMDGRNGNSKDYSPRVPGFRASTDKNRSDFADNCYTRPERQTRDGSAFHLHCGMGEYNSYHGSYGCSRARFRPKRDIEGRGYVMSSDRTFSESPGFAAPNRRTRRPYLGSCNDLQRPFMRKRSPIDRHGGTYGGQSIRDFSPDRHRFKRYPPVINRGEYHRPMPDESNEYANRIPHRMTRRDHSLSPVSGGRYYYTQEYKKSRSRSRSRSPVPILLPRERNNDGSRNRSRSPRMAKVRFPFQKRFVADCDDEDIACEPRGRFSTQRNSRWFDDRNNGVDNFRSRKSPGRMMRPNQRFDSIRRMNSDDYVRPMGQTRRFPPDVADGPGRGGYKYESSDDDRRKYNNRYEMFPSARRFDTDGGPVRRFHYNSEESFPANDS